MKRVLRGSRREETARFVAFRSHWRFAAEFCTPAEAHEKGGVENEVGTFRRNHWVPVPQARDLDDLNAHLLRACQRDEGRMLAGRTESMGAAMLTERPQLMPLAGEGFDLVEDSFPTVNRVGCVEFKTNAYSVPMPAGNHGGGQALRDHVAIWHDGQKRGEPRTVLRAAAGDAGS